MHLNKRHRNPDQRVPQRNTRVRQPARVDDDGVDAFRARGVDAVDEGALVVGLEVDEGGAERGGEGDGGGGDGGEGVGAVDCGLARAEQVEVWAV